MNQDRGDIRSLFVNKAIFSPINNDSIGIGCGRVGTESLPSVQGRLPHWAGVIPSGITKHQPTVTGTAVYSSLTVQPWCPQGEPALRWQHCTVHSTVNGSRAVCWGVLAVRAANCTTMITVLSNLLKWRRAGRVNIDHNLNITHYSQSSFIVLKISFYC